MSDSKAFLWNVVYNALRIKQLLICTSMQREVSVAGLAAPSRQGVTAASKSQLYAYIGFVATPTVSDDTAWS